MSNIQSDQVKREESIPTIVSEVNIASEEIKVTNINIDSSEKKRKYKEMFVKLKDKIIKTPKTEKDKFEELEETTRYSIFKKFIKDFCEKKEEELLNNLSYDEKERFLIKEKDIEKVIHFLSSKKVYTSQDVLKIKNLALAENGFLRNKYRTNLYKFLFMIDCKLKESNKHFKHIKLLYKDHKDERKYYKKIINIYRKDLPNEESTEKQIKNDNPNQIINNYISIFSNYKPVKYDNIIEVDVKRTIFNSIFNKTEIEKVMLDYLKEKITQKLKNFFSLDENFKYYQGFHDIAIFIYILILNENEDMDTKKEEIEENDDILLYETLQRLAEFYLKDYLVEITIKNYDYNAQMISTTKSAFKFDNIYKIINEIKKNVDSKIFDLIQNKSDFPDPIYTLPWALTYFTHDIKNINIIYRILDFVLFDHPASIYYLAANVIR